MDDFGKNNKNVKYPNFYTVIKIKAAEGTDTKAGLKLFTKVGKTIIALVKNMLKIDGLMKFLNLHLFKYFLQTSIKNGIYIT